MRIVEVNDNNTKKQFLDVARKIYRNDPYWVCPLDKEVDAIFTPGQNTFYTHGEAIRWLLLDDHGETIGRTAAFINTLKAYNFDQPTGGMGFFECIENKEAAFMLFEKCREWLTERGMEAMDGPINFGENDNFWGLLVEGFMHPAYGMNYNMPYYKEFFEEYGFKFYFEQVSNHLNLKVPFPERFWKIADWIRQKPEYRFEHFSYTKTEQFLKDFKSIYDTAWAFHENFTPIEIDNLRNTLKKAKPILEEEFIWFVYANNEPIAFLILFPDVNQILKHLNGKLHLWNKLKFVYLKKKKTITRGRITIMGVVPKYQRSGVESAIFWHLQQLMDVRPHYTELELSWVGDFNPKMRALHESVGAKFAKRHITYRKLFNDNSKYHRSTIIPVDTKEKALKQIAPKDDKK